MIPVCIEDSWVDLSTLLSPDRILHMRLVSLVNLCTLHLSLISKLCKEFCGILSCLLEKVFDILLIDIFLFLPMKMRIGLGRLTDG